tara:strand:+ start:8372 stop:9118 length:747 start_codon:yes stop_codon:yes gene_type:complete
MNRIELLELVKQHHAHMGEIEILKLINRAMDDFTAETECLKRYKTVGTTVAGQRYYPAVGGELTDTAIDGSSDILRVLNVWVNDVLTPRLISKDEAMLIDDDEHESADNALSTPVSSSTERYWYPIDDSGVRLGLVEKSIRNTTRDDVTTDFQSISTAGLQIRAHYISRGTHLAANSSSGSTYIPEIPSMYHEALTYKAIAQGYKDPRNQRVDVAQYFDNEYEIAVKKAKKRARSNNITTGHLVPHNY